MRIAGQEIFHNETANSRSCGGFTLSQLGEDNEILAFKSSDVSHCNTSYAVGGNEFYNAESDTYAMFKKACAGGGGLSVVSYHNSGSTARYMELTAFGTSDIRTDKDTDSSAAFCIRVGLICTTNNRWKQVNACANVFMVRALDGSAYNWGSLLTIDAEGDVYTDGAHTANQWDAYCDAQLARAFDHYRAPDTIIRSEWDQYVKYNEETLTEIGVLGKVTSDAPDARPMLNITQLQRVHNGAIWQLHNRIEDQRKEFEGQREEINVLKQQMTALEAGR